MDDNNDKIKKRYNRIAKYFDAFEAMMEKNKIRSWRSLIWKQAKGKVLEVGVGTGKNMQYYPLDVLVTAVDFSEKMLKIAEYKANKAGINVDLRLMDVQSLEFADETFDTIIATFVFCSVPDAVKGMKEIRRVCKKDGTIILLEHVRSKNRFLEVLMDILNPLVVRIAGANINRDTRDNLKKAGLKVDVEETLMLDIVKHFICTIPSLSILH